MRSRACELSCTATGGAACPCDPLFKARRRMREAALPASIRSLPECSDSTAIVMLESSTRTSEPGDRPQHQAEGGGIEKLLHRRHDARIFVSNARNSVPSAIPALSAICLVVISRPYSRSSGMTASTIMVRRSRTDNGLHGKLQAASSGQHNGVSTHPQSGS